MVNLLYFSGLRIGEAIALNYEDFVKGRYRNWDIMRITVNKSYNSHHRILKGTKTGKNRKVPIPKGLTTVYKEILDTHIKEGGTLDDRIITWDHSACRMMIEKACKEVGIRSYCCHDFRHTYISNLIKKGVPLPIIESASGDTQETIFKHYSHMFEGDEQMLLDSFDDFE